MASKGTKMDKRTWGAMVESAVKKAPQKAEAKAIVLLVGLLGSDEVAEPLVKYMRKMNATTADASEVIVDIQERLKAKAAAVAVAPSKKQARVRKPSKKAAAAKKAASESDEASSDDDEASESDEESSESEEEAPKKKKSSKNKDK